jgi:hypothetical protein
MERHIPTPNPVIKSPAEIPLSQLEAQATSPISAPEIPPIEPTAFAPESQNPSGFKGFLHNRWKTLSSTWQAVKAEYTTPEDYDPATSYNPYHELSSTKKVAFHAYEVLTLAPIRMIGNAVISRMAEDDLTALAPDFQTKTRYALNHGLPADHLPAFAAPHARGTFKTWRHADTKVRQTLAGARNPVTKSRMKRDLTGKDGARRQAAAQHLRKHRIKL